MQPTTAAVLPAGDYLIIDPCYILLGDRFETLIEAACTAGDAVVMTDPQTGALFAWSSTATGDGVYADQDGYRYGVDSGTLACLPLAMLDAAELVTRPLHDHSEGCVCTGRMVTFDTAVSCLPCDARGVIQFGPVAIDTGPRWEDDEDETDA